MYPQTVIAIDLEILGLFKDSYQISDFGNDFQA